MIQKINPSILEYRHNIQNLCKAPFYGHPNGCPNFGKKEGCPPAPLIDEVLDLNSEIYIIYTPFPVGKFAERMKSMHPEWSEHPRQWYNPRRWQMTGRKEHAMELKYFLAEHEDFIVDRCPEAHGINVTALMKNIGVELNWKWPPEHSLDNKVYIISLAGKARE